MTGLIERLKFFDDWADLKAAGDLMDEAATALRDTDKHNKAIQSAWESDSDPLMRQLHAMAHDLSGAGPRGIKVFNQLEDRLRDADKRIAELEAELRALSGEQDE